MELQFQKKTLPCMREILSQCREQELTQEVRLPDGMPDVGRVLGAWGQVLIRGKELRQDSISVSGGLMVWILYQPEGKDACRSVETWLPFHTKMDISGAERDGNITASASVCYVDARSVSARKFMLRTGICLNAQVHVPSDVCIYLPDELPEHVQIKKSVYPFKISAETGEKLFSIDEPVPVPDGSIDLVKVIRYSLRPEIMELKVLGGRLVFRGIAQVHVLYLGSDDQLYCFDLDLPFSQYAELEHEYEEGAEATVTPVTTSIELEPGENNTLHIKAAMTGQYVIYNRQMIDVVEDAYSTMFESELSFEQMQLPSVLQDRSQRIRAERSLNVDAERIADSEFVANISDRISVNSAGETELSGGFYLVYYDKDGEIQSAYVKWNDIYQSDCDEELNNKVRIWPGGRVNAQVSNGITMNADVILEDCCQASSGLKMVSGIELSEAEERADKPCVVLIRTGDEDLWSIAKANRSSVDAICEANGITDPPDSNKILLIPVI